MDTNLNYKNKEINTRRISNIFIKKYIIFSSSLVFIFCIIYIILNISVSQIENPIKLELLVKEVSNFTDEEFIYLDKEKYLGKGGKLVLINENLETIYANDISLISDYLSSELLEIPYYYVNKNLSVSSMSYCKYSYSNVEGKKRTVVLKPGVSSCSNSSKILKEKYLLNKLPYIFIITYILLTMFFIIILAKNIENEIRPISLALESLLNGSREYLNNYKGSYEFVEISKKLDDLAEKIIRIEWERARLDRGRQKLISDISHDLKTPMTVIQGYLIALKDGVLPKEQHKMYFDVMYMKSKHITDLLDTFFEYSKLEHPDFPINLKKCDLCNALQIYLAEKYYEIEISGFFLEVDIECEKIICEIDCKLFCRAIDNILNNTIKYNKKGTFIKFSIFKDLENAKIIIGDNGTGISKDLTDTIFEPFSTGDESRGNRYGSGLGLAITQKIIVAHHGTIELKQPPNIGYSTQFEIIIPIH